VPDDDLPIDLARRLVGPGAAEALERLSPRDITDFLSLVRLVKPGGGDTLAAAAEAAVAISPDKAQVFLDILRRSLVHAEYPELAADPRFAELWRASDRALRAL
jgi:hypothetical protein